MSEPQRPRQRILTACLGCREKKTKCDGNPVRCSACQYRDQDCVYNYTENKRKPPSKNYVKALEARVKQLEKQLALLQYPLLNPDNADEDLPSWDEAENLENTCQEVGSSNPIDEITNTLGKFQIADGGEVRYFGSRSNFNLLQTAMVSQKSSREIQIEGFNAAMTQMEPLDMSEDLRVHLLGLFWRWQNQWQHFVPRRLFLSSLDKFGADNFGPFHSPLLLTAIYALASRFSDRPELRKHPEDSNTAGDDLVARVRIMLQYECEAPTTTTVQAVMLLSLCETARDKEALGFMYCGMAARMALNLGLHVDCSKCVDDGLLTVDEVEDRRITWWGVYMLDKLFNIGLGRPSMIQERDITAKMPSLESEDEYSIWDSETGEAGQLSCRALSVAYYTRQMLSGITEILDSIYSPNISLDAASREGLATKAHVRLVHFLNSLPNYLKLPKSPSKSPMLPHVYQMHLQFHVLTILLHRPFLKAMRLSDGNISGGLQEDDSHTDACRASAEAISNIIRWQGSSYGLRTAPISTVHCIFTAAIILLLDASSDNPSLRQRAIKNFTTCIEGLEELEIPWSWSSRALYALRNIADAWKIEVPIFGKPRYRLTKPFHIESSQDFSRDTTAVAFPEMYQLDPFNWFLDPNDDIETGTASSNIAPSNILGPLPNGGYNYLLPFG